MVIFHSLDRCVQIHKLQQMMHTGQIHGGSNANTESICGFAVHGRSKAPYLISPTVLNQYSAFTKLQDAPCDSTLVHWRVKSIHHIIAQQLQLQNSSTGLKNQLLNNRRHISQERGEDNQALQLMLDLWEERLQAYQNVCEISPSWMLHIKVG